MSFKKTLLAASLVAASSAAMATPELALDYANDNMTHQEIGNGTYQGFYIWANSDYNSLTVAFSDHDNDGMDTYFSRLVISDNFGGAVDLTLDDNQMFVGSDFFGSTVVAVKEDTYNWVDAYRIDFDPSISVNQDLHFWLGTTDDSADDCQDFINDASICDNTVRPGEGQIVSSIGINVWDNSINGWNSSFNTELQYLGAGTILGQQFELTRVSEPGTLALLGLGLAGLGFARRKAAKA